MKTPLTLLALILPISIIYSFFLWNPLVFDDLVYFNATTHEQFMGERLSFKLRWLPYASIEWSRILLGEKIIWLRLGNLIIHLATTITLFFFLRRIFEQFAYAIPDRLSAHWLAFYAALLFGLHPVSVYAVAYLSQRSILMASLFTLLTWRLFTETVLRNKRIFSYLSVLTYLLAVVSKENAIMAAAVTPILLLLLTGNPCQQLKRVYPAFLLYGLIALFVVVIQIHSNHILAQAYEPGASVIIEKLKSHSDIHLLYPLSILTQSLLFFKYLWIWIAPSPAVMSIDVCDPFAISVWSFPEVCGFLAFLFYPVVACKLLLQRDVNRLLGFALFCPWILFATEFSTIRIQEPFVLYRSYLWMAGVFAALPFLCQKLRANQAILTLTVIAGFLLFVSWIKLITFSHPFLLWDDAVQVSGNENTCLGLDRMYYNRGAELLIMKYYKEAITDFDKAISLESETSTTAGYTYYNRGVAYLNTQHYQLALDDFNRAIELIPGTDNNHAYRGKTVVTGLLKELATARLACFHGKPIACKKVEQLEPDKPKLKETP